MKRVAWLTDIQLNFLPPEAVEEFFALLPTFDAYVITGANAVLQKPIVGLLPRGSREE